MGRYIYSPMNYQDYLKNYVDSLKTGELLVDLDEHDIYVTEAGFNVPIPKTKSLRDKITNYLENDLEGINLLRTNETKLVAKLEGLQKSILDSQNSINNQLQDVNGDIIDSNNKSTFISNVNANNVNQLGDISIVTDNIPDYGSEIKSIVDEFNRINNNSISGFYSKDAASNNTYLLQLWNDINKLMNTVNGKLTKMDPFSGSVTLKKNITRTINAYDVSYEDHLHQFSSWYSSPGVGYDYGRFSNDQLIQQSKNLLVPRFNQWFLNGSAEDGSGARISKLYDYGHHGTGLWYKNFHNKVNLNTGNLSSNRNPSWDLFEAVPLVGQQNGSGSGENKFFNPNYYWGVTNNFCFYVGNGNDSSFSTRLSGTGYYGGARYSSSQHDPIPSGWSGDTTDAYMNSISYIGNDPLQRNPRYTYGNSNLVIGGTNYHTFSPVQATVPVTSYLNWYYSNTGLYNKDKITFRCGLYKRVNQTVITTSHMNWNDSSNKWG